MVTAFYPLEQAARVVGGDRVDVTDLTPPGVEPHDLELTADQIDEILDADVVLYLGGGFQPGVEDAARQRGNDQVTVDVLQALGPAVLDGNGHAADPHVWLDPMLYGKVTDVVLRTLEAVEGRSGPAGRGSVRAAEAFESRLGRLDRTYRAGLAGCRADLIVTSHAAFGYLADRYGLRQEPMTGRSPEGEPDPARLAEIEDLVRAEHVTTVFTEPLGSTDVADTIARETGAKVAVLDPVESLTREEQERGDDYFTIMRRNLHALRGALGCTG